MNLLNNMGLRSKLFLLIALPLVFLFYLVADTCWEKARLADAMDRLEASVNLSVRMGAVVHELQKERGLSTGFLGSGGNRFGSELTAQREATDQHIQEFHQAARSHGQTASGQDLTRILDELDSRREAISKLAQNGSEAFAYYSATIADLLSISSGLDNPATDEASAEIATAYGALLQIKESAGQERAHLNNAFSADRFTLDAYNRFVSVVARHQAYTRVFLDHAPPPQRALFEKTMKGEAVAEVERMRALALGRGHGASLGGDPGRWFQMASVRIDLLKTLEDRFAADLLDAAANARHGAYRNMLSFAVFALICLLLSLTMAVFIIRGILHQLGGDPTVALRVARDIADGNLIVPIETRRNDPGSLMAAMKTMQLRLREVVGQIKTASDAVDIAAKEIAAGHQDLSSRTEQQAASLEETTAAMEELNRTVHQNADHARQASELAHNSNDLAGRGGDVVQQVVDAMGEIQGSSKKIADIVSLIDSIAFQTNILALNAAVEAARAGEQGRGFAVVASEVRNLSQRSAASAKEIKLLIADSVARVEDGVRQARDAGRAMHEVVASVRQVAALMAEIAHASQEQSVGIAQVARAVEQMDDTTQRNAALVEEGAAAAASLEEQARGLVDAVGSFKLN
ncbi:hypothetical protein B9N43_12110 [Denitratisoma sp. DHT3]|uniref:methyl-accepting chemotaxis protein n=1 Tax=Denitratisoma sp. DHT3 TaxID=1981880 RepID=UPI001198548F|nr:methyl-accepting chemotaxis protein [Denitratisoma sp. DHT3]QDX81930.1 hypothetical protein B9N43_12110 [Denitratisoma sp. DHT3]